MEVIRLLCRWTRSGHLIDIVRFPSPGSWDGEIGCRVTTKNVIDDGRGGLELIARGIRIEAEEMDVYTRSLVMPGCGELSVHPYSRPVSSW